MRVGNRNRSTYRVDNDLDEVSADDDTEVQSIVKSIIDRRRRSIIVDVENGVGVDSSSRRARNSKHKSMKVKPSRYRIHLLIILTTVIALISTWLVNRIMNNMLIDDDDADNIENLVIYDYDDGVIRLDKYPTYHESDYFSDTEEIDDLQQLNTNLSIQDTQIEMTERFVGFRQRLLSLYKENVPANSNYTQEVKLHPLYNKQSPQYLALDWISNIDQLRLRNDDPRIIQRYVLAVLYYSTGGPLVSLDTDLSKQLKGPWRNPTNFLSPTDVCEWKSLITDNQGRGGGVRRCNTKGDVIEILLYNELTGTIPSELGRLSKLHTLYLGRNKLTGTIPSEIGLATRLSSLSLQHNNLSGTIPEKYLKKLQLKALQLEGNEKLLGKIDRDSLLCQMKNEYEGPPPKNREKYTGPKLLRIFTATCVPDHSSFGGSNHMLECACWKVRVCVVVLSYVTVCSIFQYEVLATWIFIRPLICLFDCSCKLMH